MAILHSGEEERLGKTEGRKACLNCHVLEAVLRERRESVWACVDTACNRSVTEGVRQTVKDRWGKKDSFCTCVSESDSPRASVAEDFSSSTGRGT